MKKNITINLYGTLYAIDEDACNLLEQYLENMRSYFSRREGGEEIADDIEHRVAELLSELREQGVEAVTMEQVQQIIARIGNPEQMDDEAEASEQAEATEQQPPSPHAQASAAPRGGKAHRCLFRNPDDRMLGGVISGICQYFGGLDPLPFRILMCLLLFLSFSTVGIVYLVAWAVIPEAKTAEERLLMKGKPINPQTINEEILSNVHRAADYVQSPEFKKTAKGFWGTCLDILFLLIKLFLLFFLISLMIVVVTFFALYLVAVFETPVHTDSLSYFFHQSPALYWYGGLGLLCGFVGIGLAIYCVLFRLMFRKKNEQKKQRISGLMLALVCFVAFAGTLTFSVLFGVTVKNVKNSLEREAGMVNGIYINNSSNQVLTIDGWVIEKADNCNANGDFYSYTSDFLTEDQVYYSFDKDDERRPMSFSMKRVDNLPEGDYQVETLTALDGPGVFMAYGKEPDSLVVEALPSVDKEGKGNLYNASFEAVKLLGIFPDSLNAGLWMAQREEVEQWSYHKTATFHHKGGQIVLRIYGTMGRGADDAEILLARVVKAEQPSLPADSVRAQRLPRHHKR